MVDVSFMLEELGVEYRPTTEKEEADLQTIFNLLPYPIFVELAKHGARPKYRGCIHCPCQCQMCRRCGQRGEELAPIEDIDIVGKNKEKSTTYIPDGYIQENSSS